MKVTGFVRKTIMRNVMFVAILAVVLSWFLGGCSNSGCPIASTGAVALDASREAINGHNYDEGTCADVNDDEEERLEEKMRELGHFEFEGSSEEEPTEIMPSRFTPDEEPSI